ncbi:unnamed protein product [Lathyrus sativus]|nr:unnamed protein product [Lathyrus sativus]
MNDSKKRWTVTYTKHIKQKRKLYQDGFLVLNDCTAKLSLYDECEKLLECRLLKSDETVASGETLTFNGHLVDIGSLEGENKPKCQLNVDKTQKNVFRFRTPDVKVNAKETITRTQKPLSPSQKIIKEFKKREILKYQSPKISQETPKPSSTEWQVLYTSQMTQKAKKYHDGFLGLDSYGSQGAQVRLFDASRKLLDSRFLKKDDVIKPGESIAFDTYLVDISKDQVSHTPDSSVQGNNCTNIKRMEKIDRQKASLDIDSHVIGKREWKVLYTTQLTQKAKKYHDGFLQLECCGSLGRQVILYDLSKRPLERRFLKKDEVIEAGSMVYFAGHLVDVGEPEGSHQSPVKFSERGTGGENVEKRQQRHGKKVCRELHPSTARGQPSSGPCLRKDAGLNSQFSEIEEIKPSKTVPVVKPLHDVNQILSFLQDPTKAKSHERNIAGGRSPNKSYQNIWDIESTETMKSPDTTPTKATSGDGSFQCRENVKVSHQSSDKEAQQSINEADFDLLLSPDVHSSCVISNEGESAVESCLISNEGESAEEFSRESKAFPSFDLGF